MGTYARWSLAGAAASALTTAADELRDTAGIVDEEATTAVADWLDQRAGLLAVAALTIAEPCPACGGMLDVVNGVILCRAGCDRLAAVK